MTVHAYHAQNITTASPGPIPVPVQAEGPLDRLQLECQWAVPVQGGLQSSGLFGQLLFCLQVRILSPRHSAARVLKSEDSRALRAEPPVRHGPIVLRSTCT